MSRVHRGGSGGGGGHVVPVTIRVTEISLAQSICVMLLWIKFNKRGKNVAWAEVIEASKVLLADEELAKGGYPPGTVIAIDPNSPALDQARLRKYNNSVMSPVGYSSCSSAKWSEVNTALEKGGFSFVRFQLQKKCDRSVGKYLILFL